MKRLYLIWVIITALWQILSCGGKDTVTAIRLRVEIGSYIKDITKAVGIRVTALDGSPLWPSQRGYQKYDDPPNPLELVFLGRGGEQVVFYAVSFDSMNNVIVEESRVGMFVADQIVDLTINLDRCIECSDISVLELVDFIDGNFYDIDGGDDLFDLKIEREDLSLDEVLNDQVVDEGGVYDRETCENNVDLYPSVCSALAYDLGEIPDEGDESIRVKEVFGTIIPGDEGDLFTFIGRDIPDNSCDHYHVEVIFSNNPGGLVFDVFKGNCESLSFREKEVFTFYTDFYRAVGEPLGECPCVDSTVNPIPERTNRCSDNTYRYYIRVYSKTPVTQCIRYSLRISNNLPVYNVNQ